MQTVQNCPAERPRKVSENRQDGGNRADAKGRVYVEPYMCDGELVDGYWRQGAATEAMLDGLLSTSPRSTFSGSTSTG